MKVHDLAIGTVISGSFLASTVAGDATNLLHAGAIFLTSLGGLVLAAAKFYEVYRGSQHNKHAHRREKDER